MPVRPALLEDDLFTFQELERAIQSLKLNKSCDECGLAAELLKHTPHALLQILLELFNHVFVTGDVPSTWRRTLLRMLAKTSKAKIVSDFRPVANLRLLYKLFSYMILHRIEPVLDIGQPEEQLGFRRGRRMEKHLLTANLVVDKSRASNVPLWILSLDLSKAFDRIDWGALWQALRAQGVSAQIIWILQCMYFGQHGVVMSSVDCSKEFHIRAGVRQGCVMSPHLFCAVLEWAMRDWKAHGHGLGIVLHENQNPLVDLSFADDILMFAASVEQSPDMLRSLVDALRNAGLILNVSKTKLLVDNASAAT